MSNFKTVGIIGKDDESAKVRATLERLVAYLAYRRCEVFFDNVSGAKVSAPAERVLALDDMGRRCSLTVVVGGDGTLLHAARSMAAFGVPLVGINLGRLGFLVDVSPEEIETSLDPILAGEYDEEARHMLIARPRGGEADGGDCLALNDVVVHKWNTARMVELETYIDGVFVNAQRSDGIVISTPTGSTAYALSGGGPLIDPTLDTVVLVPISPHTLSNRPLVVAGSSHIEIRICEEDRDQVRITCDGRATPDTKAPERVLIDKAPQPIRLLHPKGHDHYKILRAKLGWGGHTPTRSEADAD
jgi:NAD+ kinase